MKRNGSVLFVAAMFFVLLFGCISGCSKGSSGSDPVVANTENTTVAQVDADGDGVREDIEQYVSSKPNAEALMAYAKITQEAYSGTITTPEDAQSMELKRIAALKNVKAGGENTGINAPSIVIVNMTSNTVERLDNQRKYEALLKGFFIVSAPGDITESKAASTCSPSSYLVVHTNGINTTKEESLHNAMDVLAPAIGASYRDEGVRVALAYNPTSGLDEDLMATIKQKMTEYPGVSEEKIIKAFVRKIFDVSLPQTLKDYISQYHINKINDSGFITYGDADLADVEGALRSNLVENQKIVLCGYSQGNIYVNQLYNRLTTGSNAVPKSAIKIVGIASPAAYVAGGGDYLTSTNDKIIAGLRLLDFAVLPSNCTISKTAKDENGHSFESVYMNPDLEGRAKIIEKIHAAMDSLVSPGGEGTQGPITVTLTWGSAGEDIDLHVTEPDGTHVYYDFMEGSVGSLDIDDVDFLGPEHYFTSCANLQPGIYRIGVNYYYGTAVEEANITIATPFNAVTRSVKLTAVRGPDGDDDSIYVGAVEVTQDSNGNFGFEIH